MNETLGTLAVIPGGGASFAEGRVLLDRKALAGLTLYAKLWPGKVHCLYRATDPSRMTYAEWCDIASLPFDLTALPADGDSVAIAGAVGNAAVVLASADDHRDLALADMLPNQRIVYIIEYTLRTRLDILRLDDTSVLQRFKSAGWLLLTERKRRRALASASGVAANGAPAYRAYSPLNNQTLLFFDTRLASADFIGSSGAQAKAAHVSSGHPLTLVYSGRLEAMKGADHLVPIAAALRDNGLAFQLHVFGDGALAPRMRRDVQKQGLENHVVFHGPVAFETELVPFLKTKADLFLCCHPQGDPSCTYLEVLGCGVPIVGFRNEAFEGVMALGACGEAVGIGDRGSMVRVIDRLAANRRELADLTMGAAEVASSRLFENTFAIRVEHLEKIARQS